MGRLMRSLAVSLSALLVVSAPLRAEEKIGSAVSIEKEVAGVAGDRNMRLKVGDDVFFQELLTTGAGSRGKFVFDDRAKLEMGPLSQVKLDSFVFASAPAVAFNAAKGVFRFASAPGGHKGYEVRTPKASIGVRGTAFGVRATPERTDAVLYDGAIEVCLPAGGACRTLSEPCSFVTVTDAGFTTTRDVGPADWSFDDACKKRKGPRRRQGAIESPKSAPPPQMAPRRAAAQPPGRGRTAAPKAQAARAEPSQLADFRPRPSYARLAPQPVAPGRPPRVRPWRPYDPTIARPAPVDDYPPPPPFYPPRPRPYPGPYFPPVGHGDPIYRPPFPRPRYPSGAYGDGPRAPSIMRGPGSYGGPTMRGPSPFASRDWGPR